MSEGRSGYRGYIASAPVRGTHFPQRVQNLVVRDYAARRGLGFKLSLTEYAMPGCYMMLENVLDELPRIEGCIVFSAFMLPKAKKRRLETYARVLQCGASLHAALENLVLSNESDISIFEDILDVSSTLSLVPGRGTIDKVLGVRTGPDEAFWNALADSATVSS
jgi:sporadic carbohydrate cluster protein (TIGR04323 family)